MKPENGKLGMNEQDLTIITEQNTDCLMNLQSTPGLVNTPRVNLVLEQNSLTSE